jgi:hypothetical protein
MISYFPYPRNLFLPKAGEDIFHKQRNVMKKVEANAIKIFESGASPRCSAIPIANPPIIDTTRIKM